MAGDTSPDVGVLYEKRGLFRKPVCRLCGAELPASKIDARTGYCLECTEKLKAKARAIEAERIASEAERVANEKEAEEREKAEKWRQTLEAIPADPVELSDGPKMKRRISEIQGLRYSTISEKNQLAFLGDFVVVDTETTGLLPSCEIIELAAIKYESFEPVARWSSLIKPEKPIPAEASAINHITDEMVAGAPFVWQVMPSFQTFVGDFALVGHNLPFDLGFLYKYGFEIQPKAKRYDTMQLAKKAYSGLSSVSLDRITEDLGIVRPDAHRALSDCFVTGTLFKLIAEELTE